MDEMERAAPGSSIRTGWLDRMSAPRPPPALRGHTTIGSTTAPRSFLGDLTADLSMRSVDSFTLSGAWDATETARWTTALRAMHAGDATPSRPPPGPPSTR